MDWRTKSAAVVASAALFFFGTGFTPLPILAALAPFPLLWLAPRTSALQTALLAFLAYFLGTTNSWALYVDSVDVPIPMAVMIVVLTSVFFALATLLFRALVLRGNGLLAVLATPAVHVSGWYLASVFSPAGIMGTLATGQADIPVVLQVASLTGAWGVDYVLVLIPSAAAALLTPGVHRPRIAAVAGLAVAATLVLGVVRLATASDTPAHTVALIGGDTKRQWATAVNSPQGQEKLSNYQKTIATMNADLTVLPEGAFGAKKADLPELVDSLRETAHQTGTTIVIGVIVDGRQNTALTIPPDGATATYQKWHDRGKNIQPGHDLVHIPNTTTALTVCGDVNFENPFRAYAATNTDLMAIPASDEDLNGWQHSRTALLRAVENGVGIAWSAQRGTLLAADAWGRTAASTPTTAPTVTLTATLPNGTGPTLYTHWGDWFAWLCLALAAAGLLISLRRPLAKSPS